jgi:hypothetical protein
MFLLSLNQSFHHRPWSLARSLLPLLLIASKQPWVEQWLWPPAPPCLPLVLACLMGTSLTLTVGYDRSQTLQLSPHFPPGSALLKSKHLQADQP